MSEPFDIFKTWLEAAKELEPSYPESFTLSTISQKGQPSSRTLLLRGLSDTHYTFFTNYNSKKGLEILFNPKASMLFYWKSIKKQVRIEGTCKPSSNEVSDEYWKNRPYESRLHAYVSEQSKKIELSKSEVNKKFKDTRTEYPIDIPRQKNWGGYDFIPNYFEFWEEGDFRWHKRVSFELDTNNKENWLKNQLYP